MPRLTLGAPLVEFPWLPATPREVAAAVARTDVEVILMNIDAGDFARGWRGFAHLPPARTAWRRAFTEALNLAADVGVQRLNVLAGVADPALPTEVQLDCLGDNLRWAPGRGAPGTGTLPWPRILGSFQRRGYDGPWMLEYRAPPGEDATSVRIAVETLTAAGRSEGERA